MSPWREAAELVDRTMARSVRAAVSCSFQAGGVALVHMLVRQSPDIPVLFVDTGYHFAETLAFRDELASAWKLNLVVLRADTTVSEQEAAHGLLHRSDPDLCCAIRKVEPLYRALEAYDLWFTGVRRDQASSRAGTRLVERKLLPAGHVVEKVNPLARWSEQDVDDYHRLHRIPRHPLSAHGYRSIGCAPCTVPSGAADPRAGRWDGRKLECGLHTLARDVS